MKTPLIAILLIFFIAACHEEKKPIEVPKSTPTVVSSEPVIVPETKKNLAQNTDSVLLDKVILTPKSIADLRILITIESKYDLLFRIKDKYGSLWGACGLGNSKLAAKKPSELVEKKELMKNETDEFIIETYVDGSTYGAEHLVIIWNDGLYWNITAAPFQRAFLEDRNNDGILEIVEYYGSKNKKGDVYSFKDGCFERWWTQYKIKILHP